MLYIQVLQIRNLRLIAIYDSQASILALSSDIRPHCRYHWTYE